MRTSSPSLHNVFCALLPDGFASDRIDDLMPWLLRRWPALNRPMARLRRHVSLKSLFTDITPNEDLVARAARALARIRRRPFVVAFNRIAMFNGGDGLRSAVLRGDEGVLGVDLLRSEIQAVLADAGLASRREHPFEAHLTLARGAFGAPEVVVEPIAWTVREFVLIHSYVGQSRYEVAGRFPLGG